MIKLKDLLSCCRSNVYIMTGPVPALIVSPWEGMRYAEKGIVIRKLVEEEKK